MNRVLYIAHRIPYPPNKGDKIRSFNTVKHLSLSYDVDLICLADDPADLKYKRELEEICHKVSVLPLNTLEAKIRGAFSFLTGATITEQYFYRSAFQDVFDEWTAHTTYEAIICYSSPMAEYVFKNGCLGKKNSSIRLLMDFCDVDSDKWSQYATKTNFPLNMLYKREGLRLLRYEKRVNQLFDHSIFVSEHEAELFRTLSRTSENISVVPNGVDSDYFSCHGFETTDGADRATLMFAGAMDYYANIEGVQWFCHKILPDIRKRLPEVVFNIVGSNPHTSVKALSNGVSVNVTGFVEDIRPYYQEADICVIPLRIARGVQNKVLEAMSMGKAVITTSAAIQGIKVKDGEHLLVADSSEGFSQSVVSLMNDPQKRVQLGQAAMEQVRNEYSWSENVAKFAGMVQQ